jgi:hypothetical protein
MQMYDLRDYKPPEKLYGEVKPGWHSYARIESVDLRKKISRNNKPYQYWSVTFDIKGTLVPFYAFHNDGQKYPEARFGKLLEIAGLLGQDFSDEPVALARALVGTELRVKVALKYKKGTNRRERRDQVVDFDALSEAYEPDEYENVESRF